MARGTRVPCSKQAQCRAVLACLIASVMLYTFMNHNKNAASISFSVSGVYRGLLHEQAPTNISGTITNQGSSGEREPAEVEPISGAEPKNIEEKPPEFSPREEISRTSSTATRQSPIQPGLTTVPQSFSAGAGSVHGSTDTTMEPVTDVNQSRSGPVIVSQQPVPTPTSLGRPQEEDPSKKWKLETIDPPQPARQRQEEESGTNSPKQSSGPSPAQRPQQSPAQPPQQSPAQPPQQPLALPPQQPPAQTPQKSPAQQPKQPAQPPQQSPAQQPKQSPAQQPKQSPAQQPKQPTQTPQKSPAQQPKQSPAQQPKQSPAQQPKQPAQPPQQSPAQQPKQPAQPSQQSPAQQPQKQPRHQEPSAQQPSQQPQQPPVQQQPSAQPPQQSPAQQPKEQLRKTEQQPRKQPVQKPQQQSQEQTQQPQQSPLESTQPQQPPAKKQQPPAREQAQQQASPQQTHLDTPVAPPVAQQNNEPKRPSSSESASQPVRTGALYSGRTGVSTAGATRISEEDAAIVAEQERRRRHISNWCKLNQSKRLGNRYVVDPRKHVLFCPLPKVASSSWKYTLGRIAGASEITELHVQDPQFLTKWGYNLTNTFVDEEVINGTHVPYKSFVFHRHPLSQLLSTYREKFTTHNGYSNEFQARIGTAIIRAVRSNATEEALTRGHDVQFAEFLQSIILDAEEKIIRDPHWTPQHQHCNPCHNHFDFIGKVENPEEADYVIRHFYHSDVSLGEKNTMKAQLGVSGETVIQKYYKTVPAEILWKLVDIYRPDFELYGYEIEIPAI